MFMVQVFAILLNEIHMVLLRKLFGWLPLPRFGARDTQRGMGEIRSAMLAMLQAQQGHMTQRVAQRVQYADDFEALWYLRQDVMTAVRDIDGEHAARSHMKKINNMFRGRLPSAMGPRRHHRFSK